MLADTRFIIADIQEGEVSVSDLWQRLHELRLSRREGRPVDEVIRQRAKTSIPRPAASRLRMSHPEVGQE